MKATPGGWYIHPFEIAVSGYSGSGKTTLLERLVPLVRGKGWSPGYIKRDAHSFSLDVPGKDTHRLREAGAETVCIEDRTHSAAIADHGPKGPSMAALQQATAIRDVVFVEGRKHSPLPKIVMLDPRGEIDDQLKRNAISDVKALLYPEGQKERALACAPEGVPVLVRDDIDAVAEVLEKELASRIPAVSAVVLLGGHSTRMGRDKGTLRYRPEMSAARQTVLLAAQVCDQVWLGVRPGQDVPGDVRDVPVLEDRFLGFGPAGGILTALYRDPRRAWLVLSCDLPLLEEGDLQRLLEGRRPYGIATALAVPNEGDDGREEPLLPEPLCAIWEPRGRSRILSFFQEGATCPRWILRSGGVHMVRSDNPRATFNANTPEEKEAARALLDGGSGPAARPNGSVLQEKR
jgi:molybdenum cofactor guanylyltransferase